MFYDRGIWRAWWFRHVNDDDYALHGARVDDDDGADERGEKKNSERGRNSTARGFVDDTARS